MKKYNEALNEMLDVIGEQILDTDEDITGIQEAEKADALLEKIKSQVLSQGWSFNKEYNRDYIPDINGYIVIPENVLSIDSSTTTDNFFAKDGKLYNEDDKSYIFTATVEADVTFDLDFDDIPVIAQNYILNKASRIFYQRMVGDTNMIQILMNDEKEALQTFKDYELDLVDANIFDDTSVSRILTRNANPTGLRG